MRAPQTLSERIAANMYSLVAPPPRDQNHRSVVANPILDYETKALGFEGGDVRAELIGIVREVAAFNVVTAPKTERKKIKALKANIGQMVRDITDLDDPAPYRSLLIELGRPRQVSSVPTSKERRDKLRLKLAGDLVLELMSDWGFKVSLHEKGQFVMLTAKVFEIATGNKRALSTAKRACTEVFDGLGYQRRSEMETLPLPEGMTEEWIEAERRADNRADVERWVPLDDLLADQS